MSYLPQYLYQYVTFTAYFVYLIIYKLLIDLTDLLIEIGYPIMFVRIT